MRDLDDEPFRYFGSGVCVAFCFCAKTVLHKKKRRWPRCKTSRVPDDQIAGLNLYGSSVLYARVVIVGVYDKEGRRVFRVYGPFMLLRIDFCDVELNGVSEQSVGLCL